MLTIKEAAERIGVSVQRMWVLIEAYKLKYKPPQQAKISAAELRRLEKKRKKLNRG